MVDIMRIKRMSDLELESSIDGHVEQFFDTDDMLCDLEFYGQPWHDMVADPREDFRVVSYHELRRDLLLQIYTLDKLIDAYRIEFSRRHR